MDPHLFRTEYAKLSRDLTDAKILEQRLLHEVEQAEAENAAGRGFPPGYPETKWLLTRSREAVQKVRNQIDRVTQRKNEAVLNTVLIGLRQRWPEEVAKIEQQTAAAFDLEGVAT